MPLVFLLKKLRTYDIMYKEISIPGGNNEKQKLA